MRIQKRQFFADIVADPRSPGVYHCIVQQKGSAEILDWTQERTQAEAVEAAKFRLARLALKYRAAG